MYRSTVNISLAMTDGANIANTGSRMWPSTGITTFFTFAYSKGQGYAHARCDCESISDRNR